MKIQVDLHSHEVEFMVGDPIYFKLKPYRQHSIARYRNENLSPHYFGPFEVQERIGKVACRSRLPPSSCILNVFHIS